MFTVTENPRGYSGGKSALGISCFHASLASSPGPIPRHSASCLEVTQVTASRDCPEVSQVPEHAGVKFVKLITDVVAPRWQNECGFIELQKVKLEWSNLLSLACKAIEKETLWEEWCKSTLQIHHVSFLFSWNLKWMLCSLAQKIHSKWKKYLLALHTLWQLLLRGNTKLLHT